MYVHIPTRECLLKIFLTVIAMVAEAGPIDFCAEALCVSQKRGTGQFDCGATGLLGLIDIVGAASKREEQRKESPQPFNLHACGQWSLHCPSCWGGTRPLVGGFMTSVPDVSHFMSH